MGHRLPLRHGLLALGVVAVWGTNFVIMKLVLEALPLWKLGAEALVLAGLAFNVLGPRRS